MKLDDYFERIGHSGSRTVSLETLNAIIAAHVRSIPFENLDVLLGRTMSLEPEALMQKLVHERRGGYCFEQNGLLLWVLQTLGFEVVPLSARARIQRPRQYTPPRTHMFLQVTLENEPWLVDVGVGGLSPTAALRLKVSDQQPTLHEPRRLVREGNLIFHQALLAGVWQDVCEFTLEQMPRIDREVAHWFTAMHPESHFRNRLLVARAASKGTRHTILNTEYSERDANGVAVKTMLLSSEELLQCLSEKFGLAFPPQTQFKCEALSWPSAADK
jgi:N-hydroxyarylamine O-acetyltransferase